MGMQTRRTVRQREAQERQEARAKLGDEGQLKKLERSGFSHTREAERLRARIEKAKAAADKK